MTRAHPGTDEDVRLRIGVSSCLLGQEVRFDGGHKKDQFLVQELAKQVEWVPVCPELEVGMGVPREAVRLVKGDSGGPRMVGVRSGDDWTERMHAYSEKRLKALERLELSGYVFKSKSPTCGIERVKVYGPNGMPEKNGRGLFAEAFMHRFPWLPIEDEGRLNDPLLRENFIEKVFAYHRWLIFTKDRFSVGKLVEFHARHKYLLLSHSDKHLRELGRIVAGAKGKPPEEVKHAYATAFFAAMDVKTSAKKHVNVLQHIVGFFKEKLDGGDRKEIVESIEEYRVGHVPRIVPTTLILHHLRRHEIPYMMDQYYLSPHPKELILKYHA